MPIRWGEQAKQDLADATEHWRRTTNGNKQITARNIGAILRDLKKIAQTPMLDRDYLPDLEPDKAELALPQPPGSARKPGVKPRCWCYAKNTDFKVYYQRIGPLTIDIARLWPSHREPLKPAEIFPLDENKA